MTGSQPSSAAELLVRCLENEGVTQVFGIPGEENIRFVDALSRSSIQYVLARHEQAAAFMAETYGRLSGRPGVCSATLGPGALNLITGVADATTNSTPLVAISAQVGMNRGYKESHQGVDLISIFRPVTKWSELVSSAAAVPEMVRKAFKLASTERPGAVYLAVPEDVEQADAPPEARPLPINVPRPDDPSADQLSRAATVLCRAAHPVILAGHGAVRAGAGPALRALAESMRIPVATTFHGKGLLPDDHPLALGAIGFMRRDYVNFGFDQADVIICVGYELQEFDPVRINPSGDTPILHIHRFPAEVDRHYDVTVGIHADISVTLVALADELTSMEAPTQIDDDGADRGGAAAIRRLLAAELDRGRADNRYPLSPARIVADTRAALGRHDIALVDTGALKMWMARLYPTYEPNTCIMSNGLSSMAWALPGGIAAKMTRPDAKILVATGDGAFLMNSQEIETALRMRTAMVILVWVDDAYGLISWKMDLELGYNLSTEFGNPDFVAYAESFGATGHRITRAEDLLPTLRTALAADTVTVVACPVDYSVNRDLIESLGDLDAQ